MSAARNTERVLSESRREREALKYVDASMVLNAPRILDVSAIPGAKLKPSPDPALTAFAELAVLRLGASRSLISIFDRYYQYVVAEATPSSSIKPGIVKDHPKNDERDLWLCGTALSRTISTCEHVLLSQKSGVNRDLPAIATDDTAVADDPDAKKSITSSAGYNFYAGTPITAPGGINIGVISVFDRAPRHDFNSNDREFMKDLSAIVMNHLDSQRYRESHRRADRMVRGIGSFVEGSSTMSGWQGGLNEDSFRDIPDVEGSLNANQQRVGHHGAGVLINEGIISPRAEVPDTGVMAPVSEFHPQSYDEPMSPPLPSPLEPGTIPTSKSPGSSQSQLKHIFSKAANIIRESIETEGVLFLDAARSSLSMTPDKGAETRSSHSSTSSLSAEDGRDPEDHGRGSQKDQNCRILGFSTSRSSSVDGDFDITPHTLLPERFLRRLIRHHPKGVIFNFDASGSLQSSELSSDEAVPTPALVHSQDPNDDDAVPDESPGTLRRLRQSRSRKRQIESIIGLFPGARSVAFFPIWDPQKQRWYAGGLAFTKSFGRSFTVEGELSYLTAFGNAIMSQILRTNARQVEKSKVDILNSLSHEFRSPLHGIILGAELLRDTSLDALQGDMLHTIETCSRTLLDTIDHLLDWSKINNFMAVAGTSRRRSITKENHLEAGMISITSDVSMDILVEEVVESVYVGHAFQLIAVDRKSRNSSQQLSGRPTPDALRWLDSTQAAEQAANSCVHQYRVLDDVTVNIDIAPGDTWIFHTQPGALRRIIMNLVGNSLKYTSQGFITVALDRDHKTKFLDQDGPGIRLTVTDTGCGMDEDFLRNDIFAPFTQGSSFTPGTGLGLPLVKKIVRALGGSIKVQSRINRGTKVTVKIPMGMIGPLNSIEAPSDPSATNDFCSQVDSLRGLRVQLIGFPNNASQSGIFGTNVNEHDAIKRVCRDWLHMEIVEPGKKEGPRPELILYDQRHLTSHSECQPGNVTVPAVVVCRNAPEARQLAGYYGKTLAEQPGKQLEFISQPVGPRKLARVLSLVFSRWVEMQTASAEPAVPKTLANTPLASEDPSNKPSAPSTPIRDMLESMRGIRAIAGSLDLRSRLFQSPSPRPAEISQESTGENLKFLLVEDNRINLKILESFMKKLGYAYETAMDGQQAVDKFRSRPGGFECILMDISMPVMDGLQATRHIRAFEAKKCLTACAVLVLTGLASSDVQEEAFNSGVDLFLTKPVKLMELSQVLNSRGLDKSLTRS